MIGNGGGGSQTGRAAFDELALAYTDAGSASSAVHQPIARDGMVDTRIKPYNEQQAERVAREEQARVFRRNQVFGLLIVAAAICLWWLLHTNPKRIFPQGWWRL